MANIKKVFGRFVKWLLSTRVVKYIISIVASFIFGIKINPIKAALYVLLVPALLFGLTINSHAYAVFGFPQDFTMIQADPVFAANESYFRFVGFFVYSMFILTCLNAILTISLVSKPNIFRLIIIVLISLAILVIGVLYYRAYSIYLTADPSNLIPTYVDAMEKSMGILIVTLFFETVGAILLVFTYVLNIKVQEKRRLMKERIVNNLSNVQQLAFVEDDE